MIPLLAVPLNPHCCSDVKISDFSHRYINQPGKGLDFHTEEFMLGYDRGL
jgi:hypothetical protein